MMATKDNVDEKIEELRSQMDESLAKPDVVTQGYKQCVELLKEFSKLPITRQVLADTKIGVYIAKLKKHESDEIKQSASMVVNQWKNSIVAPLAPDRHTEKPSGVPKEVIGGPINSVNSRDKTQQVKRPPSTLDDSDPSNHEYKKMKVTQNMGGTQADSKTYNPSSIGKDKIPNQPLTSQSTPSLKSEKNLNQPTPTNTHSQGGSMPPNYEGPLTQVQLRDKARHFLYSGFISGLPWDTLDKLDVTLVNHLISQLEDETWKSTQSTTNSNSKAYNMQIKSIKWNLADKENPQFNLRIYDGELIPLEVARMESKEMASNDKKLERKKELQRSLEACQSDWEKRNLEIKDGQFTCFRCKGKKTTYQQIQIRSADEPMTTFVTCITCNNRWKF